MKKILISGLVLNVISLQLFSQQGWTPISPETAQYNQLSLECSRITERYTAMGASRSSALPRAIFQYLKAIGTPISLKVLRDQVAAGRVPPSYLNNI